MKITTSIINYYEDLVEQVDTDNIDNLHTPKQLFFKVETLIMDKELYKNPSLRAEDIAFITKTTCNQLELAYKTAGYANFSHFIAKCRVVALKELLLQNNGHNILHLYSEVGFSNRAVASKYFKLFVGMTPTEWIKQEKRLLYIS